MRDQLSRAIGRGLHGLAVYRGEGAFVGLAWEFGRLQLDEELHWDAGAPFGTIHTAVETVHTAPPSLPLTVVLGVRDRHSGRPLRYDDQLANPHYAGRLGWWRFADTDEPRREAGVPATTRWPAGGPRAVPGSGPERAPPGDRTALGAVVCPGGTRRATREILHYAV
jgi:hypothetical protein